MNQKERVISAFELGTPEVVPVSPFGLGVWTWAYCGKSIKDYIGKPEEYAEDIIKVQKITDQDIVYVGSGCNNFLCGEALGAEMNIRETGAPTLKEPVIKSQEDLENLSVEGIYEDPVIDTVFKALKIVNERIGDKVLVGVTAWTPDTSSGHMMGHDTFLKTLYKNKDFAREVLEFATNLCIEFYKYMMENGLEFVSLAGGLASGDVTSRKTFKDLFVPPIEKIVTYFRKKGLYVFLHICGKMEDRLDLIRDEIKPHCYSMDYKTDLAKAKEVFLGHTCYAGNINPTDVMEMGSPEDVRREAQKCLEIGAKTGGFVLMPGCDLPHDTPLENIKAMIETARKFKI